MIRHFVTYLDIELDCNDQNNITIIVTSVFCKEAEDNPIVFNHVVNHAQNTYVLFKFFK